MAFQKKTAARQFGLSRSTLQFRIKNDITTAPARGPSPILTQEEENTLKNWIFECHRKGFPRRMEDIQASVKQYLEQVPRNNPFKDNTPDRSWYKAFLKRHPEISERTAEAVTAASSKVSESDIKGWFSNIQQYSIEHNLENILLDPSHIFNGDETNFLLCPKNKKVLAPRGSRNVYENDIGTAKSALTVMFTFGLVTPPNDNLPVQTKIAIQHSTFCAQRVGNRNYRLRMDEFTYFLQICANVLHPALTKLNVTFPIKLFVDGHKTHLDKNLSQLCANLQIILIALYPNATRILQLADVAAFRPIKASWKRAVLAWRRYNLC
jgi:hypothetical protein